MRNKFKSRMLHPFVNILSVSSEKIVDYGHIMTLLHKSIDQMRTDKTCPTSNLKKLVNKKIRPKYDNAFGYSFRLNPKLAHSLFRWKFVNTESSSGRFPWGTTYGSKPMLE